jgi:hypothetical protein
MVISRGKPKKLWEKSLLQCHFIHHRYHMKSPRIHSRESKSVTHYSSKLNKLESVWLQGDVLFMFVLIHKLKIVFFSGMKINVCVCWYCHVISVTIAKVRIGNWIYLTLTEYNYKYTAVWVIHSKEHSNFSKYKDFSVFMTHCLVAASNSRHSPSSGFSNCPRTQLPSSHFSQPQLATDY